jgi:hypothetical protein
MRLVLSSAFLQIFLLLFFRKRALLAASRPTEGALRGRHGRRVRDAVGVSGRSAGFSCGRTIRCDDEVVWFWHPGADAKFCDDAGASSGDDGGKTAGPREERV